jgi:hypothetical protein
MVSASTNAQASTKALLEVPLKVMWQLPKVMPLGGGFIHARMNLRKPFCNRKRKKGDSPREVSTQALRREKFIFLKKLPLGAKAARGNSIVKYALYMNGGLPNRRA